MKKKAEKWHKMAIKGNKKNLLLLIAFFTFVAFCRPSISCFEPFIEEY
jgi:hypothetical protein